jgi:hypothetical protein
MHSFSAGIAKNLLEQIGVAGNEVLTNEPFLVCAPQKQFIEGVPGDIPIRAGA